MKGIYLSMMYKNFRIKKLFSIKPSNTYGNNIKDDMIINEEGITPYISNTISNNGLAGYSVLQANNLGNAITLSDTVTSVHETIYYQAQAFIGKSHIQVLRPLVIEDSDGNEKELFILTERIALYIITAMKKSVKMGEYDYGTKFNRNAISETLISLPVKNKEDKLPDFDYMDNYIKNIIPKYSITLDKEVDNLKKDIEIKKEKLKPIINSLL